MFAYISGKFTQKSPTYMVVDVQGVGYGMQITLHTADALDGRDEGRLWIHAHIKEDAFDLYGFSEQGERDMFRHLISVSGIGPSSARVILSGMTVSETRNAILSEDELAFRRVKGVGPKTAKRVILDLKDKIAKEGIADPSSEATSTSQPGRAEAMAALVALGFHRNEVVKALNKLTASATSEQSTEALIKQGLKLLSGTL